MKKSFYIRFSIAWIMISVLFGRIYAQNMEETKRMAAQFYSIHNYEQTEVLCHRILCFGDEKDKLVGHKLLGNSYLSEGLFRKSIKQFQEALNIDPTEEDVFFDYIYALINDYQYDVALTELEAHRTKCFTRERYLLYKGICYFMTDDLVQSKTVLDSLFNFNYAYAKPKIDSLYKKVKYKNPTTSQVFSAIVPGAGQMYTGDLKNSAKAFGLNTSLLAATVYISKEYSVLNACFATFQWFARYYMSNIKNARKLTLQRNDRVKAKKYKELISILESCN